jgi:GNAT superfamily N-acetyltransferase
MYIREATPEDDAILIKHYMALWDSYGTSADHYRSDADERIGQFMEDGRRRLAGKTWLAGDDGIAAGSAGCRLHEAPYPSVIDQSYRLFGYIWHVYVRPECQKQGIGRALTQAAINYLRGLGCTAVVLNASEAGVPLYLAMGFTSGTEMRLKL